MRLRGNDTILYDGLDLSGVDSDDEYTTPVPLRDRPLESSINNNLPDSLDVDIDKSLDFNIDFVKLIKNDISNKHIPILDSQKVILHSIAFFIGFSLILFAAGVLKYLKKRHKHFNDKNQSDNLEEWVDTIDINLAEWKCNHSSIRRIEDFEDVTINDKIDGKLSRKSTISDFDTDTDTDTSISNKDDD